MKPTTKSLDIMEFLQWALAIGILFAAQWANMSQGYPYFRDRIPNGYNVTNPCNTSTIWKGVGHKHEGGGGERNWFGLDFANNSYTYDTALCKKDSDGDGRTNGEELGDPDCTWTPGTVPSRTTGITHPGICEPRSSATCRLKNAWLDCKTFSCPAFDEPATQKIDLTFPRTEVPSVHTTYICMGFKLPSDKKYHMVGIKPIIDNIKFPHHMLIYGCSIPLPDDILQKPALCEMTVQGCLNLIAIWTIGLEGYCSPDGIGFPMGNGSYEYVVMRIHWNNPEDFAGEFDASGLALYYTDQLRPTEAQFIRVGQLYLPIPPGQQNVEQVGRCSSKCTDNFGDRKLQIVAALLHMHLLGSSGDVVLTHNGVDVPLISHSNYDYNSPKFFHFSPYPEFEAGDEIKITCRYDSTSQTNQTNWGEGTHDEMCFVFVIVIPAIEEFLRCEQYRSLDFCSLNESLPFDGCDVEGLQQLLGAIGQTCSVDCSPQCMQYIQAAKDTGCYDREDVAEYIRDFWPLFNGRLRAVYQIFDYCATRASVMTTVAGEAYTSSESLTGDPQTPSVPTGPGMSGKVTKWITGLWQPRILTRNNFSRVKIVPSQNQRVKNQNKRPCRAGVDTGNP